MQKTKKKRKKNTEEYQKEVKTFFEDALNNGMMEDYIIENFNYRKIPILQQKATITKPENHQNINLIDLTTEDNKQSVNPILNVSRKDKDKKKQKITCCIIL